MRRALIRFLVLCAVLAALASAVACYRWYSDSGDPDTAAGDSASRKPANTGRVVALGTLEPKGGVRDVGATAGDRVRELKVAAGDQVEQGTPLAYLESYPLRLTEKQAAELALKEATERRKIEQAYGDNLVAEAQLGLDQLKIEQFDLDAQQAAAGLSKKNLDVAEGDLERMQNLTKKDSSIISPQELNHQKLLVDQARAKLSSDQAMLDKSRSLQGFSLRQANEKLVAAKVNRQRLLAAIDLDALQSQVDLATDKTELSLVRAPLSGQVLEIVTHPGEIIAQDPVVRMGDTKRMYAIAEVYETQVSLIAKGQMATITSDALDAPLAGRVDFIGTLVAKNQVMSLIPTDNTDLRVVKVHVSLDDSAAAAKLVNLQVRVEIDTRPAGSSPSMAER
jgi:HlyD family secretion protein